MQWAGRKASFGCMKAATGRRSTEPRLSRSGRLGYGPGHNGLTRCSFEWDPSSARDHQKDDNSGMRVGLLRGTFFISVGLLTFVTECEARGQSQPGTAPPAFEVASVKPTGRPPESGSTGWTVGHGSFTARAAWVRGLIAFAHGVHAAQVHGGPGWVDTEQYDVIAKAESRDANPDQIKAMLRTLLADRFKLVVHREAKEMPVYTLVVGKNGSKMQEAKEGEKTFANVVGPGHLVFTGMNMLGLVITLSNTLGNPIIDKTGLTGFYDFKLDWTNPLWQKPGKNSEQLNDSLPDLFGAVQDQLGLKLDAGKGPAEIVVIDRIERASEN